MDVVYDPRKSDQNESQRGLSFDKAPGFDFATATFIRDERFDYGEERWLAVGYYEGRLHVICFVDVPEGIRVISFRRANAREGRKYGRPQTLD